MYIRMGIRLALRFAGVVINTYILSPTGGGYYKRGRRIDAFYREVVVPFCEEHGYATCSKTRHFELDTQGLLVLTLMLPDEIEILRAIHE